LKIINAEDATIANAVSTAIPEIAKAVDCTVNVIRNDGRIFYVGAGTRGRIATLDAAECPPTFSTPPEWIQAIIAGGARAIVEAVEGAEDNRENAAADLKSKTLSTGYGRRNCRQRKDALHPCRTGICPSNGSENSRHRCSSGFADVEGGRCRYLYAGRREIIAGSTRMKAGTAQKLVLNMISTAAMIRIGMTYSNWMINVQMTNASFRNAASIYCEVLGVNAEEAETNGSSGENSLADHGDTGVQPKGSREGVRRLRQSAEGSGASGRRP
jgi:N-acetylmuramic acid 6-phosphate etherase